MNPRNDPSGGAGEPNPKPTPRIWVQWDRRDPNRLRARYDGATSEYVLSMGDGMQQLMQPGMGTLVTAYRAKGSYLIVAHELGSTGKVLATQQVTVRDSAEAKLTIEQSTVPGEDYVFVVTNPDDGIQVASRYTINWGSLAAENAEQVWLAPGETWKKTLREGSDTVHVTDDHAKRSKNIPVTVDTPYDPDYEVLRDDTDPTHHTVILKLTKVTSKTLVIDWGEDVASPTEEVTTPTVGQEIKHTYTAQPPYESYMQYKDGSGNPRYFIPVIPWDD